MAGVEERLAGNGDDWRFGNVQLLSRASVKREWRTNAQRSIPHRPLYSRDHGPLIPSEVRLVRRSFMRRSGGISYFFNCGLRGFLPDEALEQRPHFG